MVLIPTVLELTVEQRRITFVQVGLVFLEHGLTNIFTTKNNKTLAETIEHWRYKTLAATATRTHQESLHTPLGVFLAGLKSRGDMFYKRFLNPHGDEQYCHFRMTECTEKRRKGLYIYSIGNEIVYIGRSFDSFGKRVDQGYGKIHPKNCYLDGQSTNCHLNSLIESRSSHIGFYLCPLEGDTEIENLERQLIRHQKPAWNVALAK